MTLRYCFLALTLASPAIAGAQTLIAAQSFEGGAGDTWAINLGAGQISNDPGPTDHPPGARIRTGGASWQVNDATATLELAPQTLAGYGGVQVVVYVSTTALSGNNGADVGDAVRLFVALDGGPFPATADLTLTGRSNANHGYTENAVGTTAGVPQAFETTDATQVSRLVVDIPDGTFSVALRLTADNDDANEVWNVDDVQVVGVATSEDTSVQFAAASGEAAEGDGAFALTVSIARPSETVDTEVDVVFLPGSSTGASEDIGGFTVETVTFPAGSGDDRTVTVALTDDALIEEDEAFVFELQNVQGGQGASIGSPSRFTLTLSDDDHPFINEVDADTPGSDRDEFIELYDGGVGGVSLDGLLLVLFDGGSRLSYRTIDLDGHVTDAAGFFVVGNERVAPDFAFANGVLQNGPDAVALYVGDPSDFPNGTPPTAEGLVDAVVYGTGERDDGLLRAFGTDAGGVASVVTVQFDEGYRAAPDEASLQRLNLPAAGGRGGGGVTASGLLYPLAPTPRAPNPAAITVDETAAVADVAGWRVLSSPLYTAYGAAEPGPTVADYAGINLVQGIPGEYPGADPNLFHEYEGGGVYAVPGGTDTPLAPGQGFFWFWFDEDFGPFEGGTSRSYDLANPDFHLALEGVPPDDALEGGPLAVPETAHADGFYLTGNPFAYPLRLGAARATSGTLHTNFGVWDPGCSTYEVLTADFDDPYAGAVVPVWNGAFAEVEGASGPFAITYTSAYVDPTAGAALVGRRGDLAGAGAETDHPGAARPREARLALRLDGVADNGDAVADHAALLRFRDDAAPGWDRHDGSKMYPRAATVALLAPVGERDGAPYRQAVRSLPYAPARRAGTAVPVDFFANHGGAFALSWALHGVPDAWALRLRDGVTGAEVDLRADTSYAFTSEATGWTGRFTVTVAPGGPEADAALGLPGGYALGDVHPNPTRASARLTLRVAEAQAVTVALYDVLGRRVALLHDGPLEAGAEHAFTVDGRALANGLYLVRVRGETFSDTRRLVRAR